MLLEKYSLYAEFEALWEGDSQDADAANERLFQYLNYIIERPPQTPSEAATYLKIAQTLLDLPPGRSSQVANQLMAHVRHFLTT